jgi:hypothetical protein
MFSLIKNTIWIVGFVVVTGFILNYFGYEVNKNYFKERKTDCQQKLKNCQSELLHQGIDNASCDFNCVNPKLVIKKIKQ